MKIQHRYAWPASAISTAEMSALYRARESFTPKVPISKLLSQAVRQVYSRPDATATSDPLRPDPATTGLGEAAA